MADEAASRPEPTVTEVGGTQSVQLNTDPAVQAQIEGDKTNQVPPQAPATERPEGLPEGFNSWEEFGKAQLAKGTEEAPKADALSEEQQAQVAEAVKGLPEDKREVAQPFFEEFARAGTLSDESVTAAAKAFGVSEDMVRVYMGNAQAQSADAAAPVIEQVGGAEVWKGFQEYAEANYTAEQKEAFNKGLDTDPAKTVAEAVKAWKESGNGPAPRDITRGGGGVPPTPEGQGYQSQAEMTRDMGDPRYSKDPAFRAKVEEKVRLSDFGNVRSY